MVPLKLVTKWTSQYRAAMAVENQPAYAVMARDTNDFETVCLGDFVQNVNQASWVLHDTPNGLVAVCCRAPFVVKTIGELAEFKLRYI